MNVLRNRLAACLAALAFAAVALPACGDGDDRGAAEEIDGGADEIEKGAEKGADEVEKQGNEIDDDVKGTDEKRQRDK